MYKKIKVFSDLGLMAKFWINLGQNLKGFCEESFKVLSGYGLILIWDGKLKDLVGFC